MSERSIATCPPLLVLRKRGLLFIPLGERNVLCFLANSTEWQVREHESTSAAVSALRDSPVWKVLDP